MAKEKDAPAASVTEDLYETRLEKLRKLQQSGYDPYAQRFRPADRAADLHQLFTDVSADESRSVELQGHSVGGRVRSKRMMGKAGFLDLHDESGRIQLYGSQKDLSPEQYEIFRTIDLGDIVGARGYLFATRTGETTLHLTSIELLSKCIRPLPVVKEAEGQVFDAFSDKEQRYRQRYVDLIVNPEVRETFVMRSRIIASFRRFLSDRGYLEVETPMMQPIPGGASARPFTTHHNALDIDLFLRIAPELYLKRLIVGGFPRVFEINRNFRNEGISYKHNPEFTMLELYEAFGDISSMMALCEEMIPEVCREVHGKTVIECEGHQIDLTPPWERLSFLDSITRYGGVTLDPSAGIDAARKEAIKVGISPAALDSCHGFWDVAELLFDELVESKLIQPVFITDYPVELSPLAKSNPEKPGFVERFEPYVLGREIGNAFSELNDPIDQKERFAAQVARREGGDEEGGYMDHDYIRALEYAMPPAGGMGIGIDRVVMLLTDQHSIRDTILFPLMRPES